MATVVTSNVEIIEMFSIEYKTRTAYDGSTVYVGEGDFEDLCGMADCYRVMNRSMFGGSYFSVNPTTYAPLSIFELTVFDTGCIPRSFFQN